MMFGLWVVSSVSQPMLLVSNHVAINCSHCLSSMKWYVIWLLAVFSIEAKKLNTGFTAEWFKNWFSEKYTCPIFVVDSSNPPLTPITNSGIQMKYANELFTFPAIEYCPLLSPDS